MILRMQAGGENGYIVTLSKLLVEKHGFIGFVNLENFDRGRFYNKQMGNYF
ncbi:hypothetical protein [Peribacillus glennii]|uniref:hypothetical protein n=1 Tax=Peribacillus glennii TaxID=2303991 RepID=UPI001314ACBF|nr:hypothetical protein [Peribacillus glennii]